MKQEKKETDLLYQKKKITIKEIAKKAGVSPTTVSNVLHGNQGKVSENTAKRVQKVLDESEYEPSIGALILAGSHSHVISVLVGTAYGSEIKIEYQAAVCRMLEALEREISLKNYYMLLHFCNTAKEGIRFSFIWRAEGIITIGFKEKESSLIQENCWIPLSEVEAAGLDGENNIQNGDEDYSRTEKRYPQMVCKDMEGKAYVAVRKLLDLIDGNRKLPKTTAKGIE